MLQKGNGMLFVLTDMDPAREAEFNCWYNKEHMGERIAIPGFLDARRYVAVNGSPKYLALYATASLATFTSPLYKKALATQSDWSKRILPWFENMHRTVGAITATMGYAHGGALALVWFNPADGREGELRDWLEQGELPSLIEQDEILSAHLLEGDPSLSGPVAEHTAAVRDTAPASNWFVLVEGMDADEVAAACREPLSPAAFERHGAARFVSFAVYRLIGAWEAAREAP